MPDMVTPSSGVGLRRLIAWMVASAAVVVGLAFVLVAVTIGDCAAFGGRCPAEAPPVWEDDVFGMAAFGAGIASAVPIFLAAPSRRRLAAALAIGVVAALVVGLLARSSANA